MTKYCGCTIAMVIRNDKTPIIWIHSTNSFLNTLRMQLLIAYSLSPISISEFDQQRLFSSNPTDKRENVLTIWWRIICREQSNLNAGTRVSLCSSIYLENRDVDDKLQSVVRFSQKWWSIIMQVKTGTVLFWWSCGFNNRKCGSNETDKVSKPNRIHIGAIICY